MTTTDTANRPMRERIITRFGATFIASLLRTGLSFVSGVVIARGLGASRYGDLYFLLGSFTAVSQLLEMGTASAFYTFISRRRRGRIFFTLYLAWLAFQFAATVLAIGLLLPPDVLKRVWVGHERSVVLLALGASFLMTQVWGLVSQLGEAARKTVFVQAVMVAQAAVHLALIGLAAWRGWLSIHTVMWLLVLEYALVAAVIGPRLVSANMGRPASAESPQSVAVEFAGYCRPLVIYSWVGFLYAFADRWLLQQFGGSVQQGFFAVAQQFANVSLIATTSILKVFWKEIAEAQEHEDHERVRYLYLSVLRSLYAVGAWLSCLAIPYTRELLGWLLGAGYEAAWFCLALMLLYPIHQSVGQISGTYLFATGETGSYTRIGLLMMALSIPVTYVLLALPSARVPGLGLGAVGLAVKMVVLQIVGVNLQTHAIARANGWAYSYGYQASVLGSLLGLAWASKWVSREVLGLLGAVHPIGVLALGAFLYAGSSLIVIFRTPELIGIKRNELAALLQGMTQWLRPTAVAGSKVS